MPRLVLEGGTDVAEMVLFSIDELPSDGVSETTLSRLVDKKQAIRMPTGADGRYLLHLFIDEEIPDDVKQFCVVDDAHVSELWANSGRVSFGGAESTFGELEQNPNIREDAEVPPGWYDVVAYHTEYPEELIEDAVKSVIGADGVQVMDFAGTIIMSTVGLAIAFLVLGGLVSKAFAIGGVGAAIMGGVLWYRSYTRSDKYKRLDAQQLEVQREYPSIVIHLSKREASGP